MKRLNISRVEADTSRFRIIKSFNQLNDGALTRSRGAYNGSGFAFLEYGRKIIKNFLFWTCRIPEGDVFELNLSLDFSDRFGLDIV
jgi:hypothetical protein